MPGAAACDAEVEDLHQTLVAVHHVCRLDVAMDDARGMGVVKAGTKVLEEEQLCVRRVAARRRMKCASVFSGHVLHRDEGTVIVFADVEHGHDVGMMQPARRPRFPREPLARRVVVEPGSEQLDDHEPVDRRVAREIHRAHAAVAISRSMRYRPTTDGGTVIVRVIDVGARRAPTLCECLVRTERMSKPAGDDPIASILPTAGASAPFQYQRLRD